MCERLQKLNLCMSHVATNRLLHMLGDGHDTAVKEWRDKLVESLKDAQTQVDELTQVSNLQTIHFHASVQGFCYHLEQ